jgi:hypothetical protein
VFFAEYFFWYVLHSSHLNTRGHILEDSNLISIYFIHIRISIIVQLWVILLRITLTVLSRPSPCVSKR